MTSIQLFQTQTLIDKDNIQPRQFIHYCFGIDELTPQEILEEETNFEYRSRCIGLFSRLLGVRRKTVREWGNNPNFEDMPGYARQSCTYSLIALSRSELNRVATSDFIAPAITATEFIEEIFLKDLSQNEKLKLVSSTRFRSKSFSVLSDILQVSKSSLYQWGSDFELDKMPKRYEHTLAYALGAYRKQEKVAA